MLDLLEGGTPTRMIRLGRINTPAKLVQGEEE